MIGNTGLFFRCFKVFSDHMSDHVSAEEIDERAFIVVTSLDILV